MESTEKKINDQLNAYHIAHANLGYSYLMAAIMALVKESVPRGFVSEVYRLVAEQFHTKDKYVEKAITAAIKKAGIEKTNKEFILTVLDAVIY